MRPRLIRTFTLVPRGSQTLGRRPRLMILPFFSLMEYARFTRPTTQRLDLSSHEPAEGTGSAFLSASGGARG